MRAKRPHINFRKLKTGKLTSTVSFFDRPHSFYQPGLTKSYSLRISKRDALVESHLLPFLKISKQMTNRSSFFTKAISLSSLNTAKPNGIRMGKGKGKPNQRLALPKADQPLVIFREIQLAKAVSVFNRLRGRTTNRVGLALSKLTY